jgi:hypothetical protein
MIIKMDIMAIRHKLEDKVKEFGGDVQGAGCMMVFPFTADFEFKLGDRKYDVYVTQRFSEEEKEKWKQYEKEHEFCEVGIERTKEADEN